MPDQSRVPTSNEELVTARELNREFASRMRALEMGELEKLILTRHGKMVGVVLSMEKYVELTGDH